MTCIYFQSFIEGYTTKMILNQTIKKFKQGSSLAFQSLYENYSSALMGVCLRFARNNDDAEDMLQEGFIKIYRYRKSFDTELDSGFYAWAKKIIINTSINYCRKHYKYNFSRVDVETLDSNTNAEHVTSHLSEPAIEEAKLLKMIQALPDGYRTVFNLYVFEGLTHQEIADYLAISVNTSKSQLSRARKILQQQINLIKEKKRAAKVS